MLALPIERVGSLLMSQWFFFERKNRYDFFYAHVVNQSHNHRVNACERETKNEPIREEQNRNEKRKNSFHCGFAVLTAVCSFSPRLKPTAPLWVKNVPPQDEPIGTHSCSHTLIAVWPDTITHEREREIQREWKGETPLLLTLKRCLEDVLRALCSLGSLVTEFQFPFW